MSRLKVIYLKQSHADPLWMEVTTSLLAEHHDVRIYDPQQSVEGQFADVDAVVDMGGANATQELVDAASNAKLWQIVTVGYDFFDMDMLRRADIPVCHCPGQTSAGGLAESAIMFMLLIVHRYNEAQQVLAQGKIHHPMGAELSGRVLGLIGFGASGMELARLAQPFGLRYMIVEPRDIEPAMLDKYQPEFVGKPDDMDQVFEQADFVSLHLPLSPETKGIVDAKKIGLMKSTACLINTARGDLVDQDAMYDALVNHRLGGIGTDVHQGVHPQPKHPVYQHPNFYALSHVAGTTTDCVRRRSEVCLENLNLLAEGKSLKYRVD